MRNVAAGQIVFAEQALFVQTEIAGNGAHKAATEYSARQLLPILVLQRLQKALADARRFGQFVQRNLAHFPFALQALSETTLSHKSNLPPAEPSSGCLFSVTESPRAESPTPASRHDSAAGSLCGNRGTTEFRDRLLQDRA